MKGYVYSISEKITNNILYIGSSICPENRLQSHKVEAKRGSSPFYEYLLTNKIEFYMEIIEEIEIQNKSELLSYEIYWIHQFKEWGFQLKNSIFYKSNKNKDKLNDYITPLRLGDLKPILQEEAKNLKISLHRLILQILENYLSKKDYCFSTNKNRKYTPHIKKPS